MPKKFSKIVIFTYYKMLNAHLSFQLLIVALSLSGFNFKHLLFVKNKENQIFLRIS